MSETPNPAPEATPSDPSAIEVTAKVFPLDIGVVVPLGSERISVGAMQHDVLGPTLLIMPLSKAQVLGEEAKDPSLDGRSIYLTFARQATVTTMLRALQNLLDTWPAGAPSSESPADV